VVALALILAVITGLCAAAPGLALYLGIGTGILAIATGRAAFRRADRAAGARLLGAAAGAVGGVALALCLVRYGLILAALDRLDALV
jgi:hypothetical protein